MYDEKRSHRIDEINHLDPAVSLSTPDNLPFALADPAGIGAASEPNYLSGLPDGDTMLSYFRLVPFIPPKARHRLNYIVLVAQCNPKNCEALRRPQPRS